MDETMKCIPEVSEADVEVLRGSGFGASRYGEVLLARFKDASDSSHNRGRSNNRADKRSYWNGNDEMASSEAEADKNGATASGEETLVILKTLTREKLRPEFLHEMKSKWFISAKSERVAKLIGYLSTGLSAASGSGSSGSGAGGCSPSQRGMAMVLECGNCDLAHFLRTCDKKTIG